MIFLGYVLSFLLLNVLLRRVNRRLRDVLILGYNVAFAAVMHFIRLAEPPMDLPGFFATLGAAVMKAPGAVAFQGDAASFGQTDAFFVFLFMSLYTVRTVLSLFFLQLYNELKMSWRLLWRRRIFVIVGEREAARALIKDLTAAQRRCAVVYIPDQEAGKDAKPMLGAWESDGSYLKRLRKGKQYDIVLLPDRGVRNYRLLRDLEEQGEALPEVRVTAFLDNEVLRMEDLRFDHLDLYLVSEEQLVVQEFMGRHLPLAELKERFPASQAGEIYAPPEPFSLCVVGFTPFAREFLLETYENTAFETASGERGLRVTVMDGDMAGEKAAFCHRLSGVAEEGNITWLEAAPWSEEFYRAVEGTSFHQILIATPDTDENLRLTMELRRLLAARAEKTQLVVALFREDRGAAALLSGDPQVFLEQVNEGQYTYAKLIERSVDRQARALHQTYLGNLPGGTEWSKLGTFTQASNRAVVWDVPNKLLLAGDTASLTHDAFEKLLWQLARYEHSRWNAFHYARGWRTLAVSELTEGERSAGTTKHPAEKRHTCLVGWDELDALPQARPGLLKYYDYENVARLFPQSGEDRQEEA